MSLGNGVLERMSNSSLKEVGVQELLSRFGRVVSFLGVMDCYSCGERIGEKGRGCKYCRSGKEEVGSLIGN